MLGQTPAAADILWPANGVILAALLKLRPRFWISYLAGSFGMNMLIHMFYPFPVEMSLLFSAANVVEIYVAAACLSHYRKRRLDMTSIPELGRFLLFGVLLAPLVSTIFVAVLLIPIGRPANLPALWNWYIGDALGIAIVTPLVIAVGRREIGELLNRKRRVETIFILGGLFVLSVVIFAQSALPIVFLLLPALLLVIFRLGGPGSAVGVFLMVAPAAVFTARGRGPFAPAMTGSLLHSIWLLQCFLSVSLITIYSVCAALTERDRVQSEWKAAYQEAYVHAGVDHITGLANRRSFDKRLAFEWRRALLENAGISLMMIDVDQFKLFNDHYGHPAGDACLAALGALFRQAPLRETDLAARYGGEEFAVILPHAATEGAMLLADRIRQAVADQMIPHALNQPGIVTISVGVATMRPDEQSGVPVLIERADRALYEAKHAGKNQVVAWRDSTEG